MATHRLDAMLSHSAAVTRRERNLGSIDIDQASLVMPTIAIPPRRRWEARMNYRLMCSYEVLATEVKLVVIEQGEAFALNRSKEGILLLMGQALHVKQLIRVYSPRSGWGRTVTVFEARWARPVRVESFGNLYLVGCQRIFGPRH
jgi:hypothetical protein